MILEDHLKKIFRNFVNSGLCSVIGLQKVFHQTDQTGFGSEFSDEKKSCIGGKIAAGEIYFYALIAFKGCGV